MNPGKVFEIVVKELKQAGIDYMITVFLLVMFTKLHTQPSSGQGPGRENVSLWTPSESHASKGMHLIRDICNYWRKSSAYGRNQRDFSRG